MKQIKKSDLKNYLSRSISLFKRNLDHEQYCHFLLTSLFYYHTIKYPTTHHLVVVPRSNAIFPSGMRDARPISHYAQLSNLSEAYLELENHNPVLKDVLHPSISMASISDQDLLDHFTVLDNLQKVTGVFSTASQFSHAYDYWISQLANVTTKQSVSFYLPRSVTRLMVGLVKPAEGMMIYDPSAGTGGMFTESARYIQMHDGKIESLAFYGCEKVSQIWAICKMNMLVHGLDPAYILHQDVLQNPEMPANHFDIVLQRFPILPNTMHKGETRRLYETLLWHMLDALGSTGRSAVLVPATIIREDHLRFWQQVVTRDWLEAVISLPANLLQGSSSSAYLLIFNKSKAEHRKDHVLFVSTNQQPMPTTQRKELDDLTIETILKLFDQWSIRHNYANIVHTSRIEKLDYRLSVEKYLGLSEEASPDDIIIAFQRYEAAVRAREVALAQLKQTLKAFDKPFNVE